jgi:hypothetical protein
MMEHTQGVAEILASICRRDVVRANVMKVDIFESSEVPSGNIEGR